MAISLRPPPPPLSQLSLLFDGDGQWYRGEVIGYDAATSRALLLYDDGEDEWVDLGQEELSWHCQLAGHSGVYPGVPRGEDAARRGGRGPSCTLSCCSLHACRHGGTKQSCRLGLG